MSIKALGPALVFCAMLLGCATNPFGGDIKALRCAGPSCDVQVAVSCSVGLFCTAFVDSDTVQVPRGNSPNITWQLTSAGYTFASNGIVFSDGGREFVDCHPEANGRRFKCHDKHTGPGRYKYTINISGSPPVAPLDPFIANE